MGARGPTPTPSAIKAARGTYRADRTAPNEPQALGRPTPPKWLSDDGKQEFRRLVKELSKMGVVGRIDANAIARYCIILLDWLECLQKIKQFGSEIPVKDGNGKTKCFTEPPWSYRASRLADQLLKLEACFGMNPSARSRINAAPAAVSDELGDFLDAPPLRMAGTA